MKLLYNVAEVRYELYQVLSDLQEMQNHHIAAWQQIPEGHRTPCACCADYESRKFGVRRAIRHFGGKPRR